MISKINHSTKVKFLVLSMVILSSGIVNSQTTEQNIIVKNKISTKLPSQNHEDVKQKKAKQDIIDYYIYNRELIQLHYYDLSIEKKRALNAYNNKLFKELLKKLDQYDHNYVLFISENQNILYDYKNIMTNEVSKALMPGKYYRPFTTLY